jgi:hypothetical protein
LSALFTPPARAALGVRQVDALRRVLTHDAELDGIPVKLLRVRWLLGAARSEADGSLVRTTTLLVCSRC